MQFQNYRHPWNVRALLESTATPFTIAITHHGTEADSEHFDGKTTE